MVRPVLLWIKGYNSDITSKWKPGNRPTQCGALTYGGTETTEQSTGGRMGRDAQWVYRVRADYY